MKKLSVMVAMALTVTSFSANAIQVTISPIGTGIMSSAGLLTTSGEECGTVTVCKLADQIVIDAQEYFASGIMSELLIVKVAELKETAGDISDEEAVGILAEFADRTLHLY